ncbi:MAG: hypothetical protein V3U92_04215 [Cellulophaga sp.]
MKKAFANYGLKLSRFCCSIFGHHYSVSKKVTSHIKEYKCIHCYKEVTTDVSGNLSALTPELQEINETLERLYQKKHTAAKEKQVA